MGTCKELKGSDLLRFPRLNGIRGAKYLKLVSEKVSEHRRTKISLKSPAGATLTIGPLQDTEYKDKPDEVKGCSKFYLPTAVKMEVIGYIGGTLCPCDQLLMMICENGKLYGYDGDELHLVASSQDQLFEEGIDYPSSKSFHYGQAFNQMTKEDWDKVRSGPTGKRLDEDRCKRMESEKSRVSKILRLNRQKQRLLKQHGSPLPDHILNQMKNEEIS